MLYVRANVQGSERSKPPPMNEKNVNFLEYLPIKFKEIKQITQVFPKMQFFMIGNAKFSKIFAPGLLRNVYFFAQYHILEFLNNEN